jgi:penicillin-binding protein 1B
MSPIRRVRGKKRRRGKKRESRFKRRLIQICLLAVLAGSVWLLWPYWRFSEQFADHTAIQPSRLYGRSKVLAVGAPGDLRALRTELEGQGYSLNRDRVLAPGEFEVVAPRLRAFVRAFPTPEGWDRGGELEVETSGWRISALRWHGKSVDRVALEPPLLASFYGAGRKERRPVGLEALPEELLNAVLAAEDAKFYKHPGLSATGIARAAWVNLRGGEIRQGGSTLTQQLVKNLFLTHERTLVRKLREAVLAVLLDLRFEKDEILTAYLNEIYWGQSHGVNLMGVGAAAWAYFGRYPHRLTLCESAVLAGMIRSPGGYSPITRPERALERRDWVLGRMAELGWLEAERAEAAQAEPLCVSPQPVGVRRAGYFADAMALEAERRFGVDSLADSGHLLISTLNGADQQSAEKAIAWGMQALEEGWEKGRKTSGPLQGALVSIDPRSGAILAYVGGRDYSSSQFDRAGRAQRQTGSAFKPVVYATAFEDRLASPTSLLEDAPLTVALAGREWSPQNSDSEFRGWVTVRTALEDSLNVPTARLGMYVGLPRVVEVARDLGIESRLQPVPALALGAFEVTPVELATVYATLAGGGVRRETYGLEAVLDRDGKEVEGRPLAEPQRALSPEATYLLTSILQGVIDRGTGSSARLQGMTDPLAGKTGTTNDRRDSWFAGFSPDRATLVWVGYDDNSTTRLSGARAALPIWARFTYKVRPPGGYPTIPQPAGVATAVIDPQSGELATDDCPQVLTEVFRQGEMPAEVCSLHGGGYRDWSARRLDEDGKKGRWRWLKRIFGKGDKDKPPPD